MEAFKRKDENGAELKQPTIKTVSEVANMAEQLRGLAQFNPSTPVLPVTARDEPWPFFHFWRHHFRPKLASFVVNFCRRKRSFQWCPDQSDRLNGALDMHKNAQKVEQKTQSKISCHFTWLFSKKFFDRKQAQ